jgi:hypothetical protein
MHAFDELLSGVVVGDDDDAVEPANPKDGLGDHFEWWQADVGGEDCWTGKSELP